MNDEPIRLTQFSHGAGCGCKISPKVLDAILAVSDASVPADERLLVGNHARDDAAAYDLGTGMAMLSTTDFFMPIVDDPFDFGRIASANAVSDIYAMGGAPTMALGILGWPTAKLGPEVASRVIEGARALLAQTGAPLAGGHSIDTVEPIFGLAVSGLVPVQHLKTNGGANPGCLLFLTKPLGVGILSTAEKRGLLTANDHGLAVSSMVKLNAVGSILGTLPAVRSMTDVTGFGLLGHLGEMCRASQVAARIDLDRVPLISDLDVYLDQGAYPGGTERNWASYGMEIGELDDRTRRILCDPQTSGGLLVAATVESADQVVDALMAAGLVEHTQPIGELVPYSQGPRIQVF
jgi:selenide, water dikinase